MTDNSLRGNNTALRSRVITGMVWKLLELLGAQGIQFVIAIILARLLTPKEYGTIGLITVFITIANVFVQSGFSTALVQKQNVEYEDYSSVFWISIALSAFLYAILWFAAPFIAGYYETPVLSELLKVMGTVLFPGAVISIQTAYISRNLDFKKLFISTIIAVIISGAASIWAAYENYGVWAMALQQIIYYYVLMITLFITVPWHPGKSLVLNRLRLLFSFGWKILLSGLIDTVWTNIYSLIIGKRYSGADLGAYNRGEQFPKLVTSNLSASIQAVMLPAYSKEQGRGDVLKSMMKRSIRLSAFATFPMMAGLMATAVSLVRVLLTDRWLICVPFLRVMCVAYAMWPIHVTNLQMLNANGRSDLFLRLELIKKVLGILILWYSLRFGVVVMLVLRTIDEFLCTFINAWPNKRLIGYGIAEQYKDMFPAALCAAIMGFVIYGFERLTILPLYILILQIATGMLIYFVTSYLFNRESLRYVFEIIKSLRKRTKINYTNSEP